MAPMSETAPARRLRLLVYTAGLLWIAAWIGFSRYALLDDALIHLRYARMLLRTGFLTFDGTTFSYGTSSPLYIGLLAILSSATASALLPKILSVVFYLALLLTAVGFAAEGGERQGGWVLLSLILVSPMAIRWLTDGMETSLAVLLAVLLATQALASGAEGKARWAAPLLYFALGAVIVLTRIELALAIFFAFAGALPLVSPRLWARRHLPLALGGLGSLALLRILFGHVLPDTAMAKRTAPVAFWEALYQVERSTLSSLTLGAGLTILWMFSLLQGLRVSDRRGRIALLTCNLLFPGLVALIATRGQILHGVRYLLWVYLFLIVWNLRVRARVPGRTELWPRGRQSWIAGGALLVLWIFEGRAVARVLEGRNQMFLAMRSDALERLRGTTGAGFDIGFIGFFSQAGILDLSGLVNGRTVAKLTPEQRLRRMSAANPDFLFVTGSQAESLTPFLNLSAYRICRRYRAASLTMEQVYFLASRSDRTGLPPCAEPLTAELPLQLPGAREVRP
jgi:hypothetical protein